MLFILFELFLAIFLFTGSYGIKSPASKLFAVYSKQSGFKSILEQKSFVFDLELKIVFVVGLN